MTRQTNIQGIELCGEFYRELVQPLLDRHFPGLKYSAALVGDGSEVLGFDDSMSTDHHWGPRLMLFLEEADFASRSTSIHDMLAENLPTAFRGFSTHFSPPNPDDNGVQLLEPIDHGPVNHRVEMYTLRGFVKDHLGCDLDQVETASTWLALSQQKLLTLTAGAVYHDEIGLENVRTRFSYYPQDVWLYLLAAGWARIGQEEHLMGRAGLAGDEVGSALIGSRLVRDVMRLCFLMERQYAPYPKWFGTAFKRLSCGPALYPTLRNVLSARTWQTREKYLVTAYELIAAKHNTLGLTEPLPETVTRFFGRPFRVIALHGFADALLAQIVDPQVKAIAAKRPIGAIDQFSDSTDLLSASEWHARLVRLYE
jgi:hypothetical protein